MRNSCVVLRNVTLWKRSLLDASWVETLNLLTVWRDVRNRRRQALCRGQCRTTAPPICFSYTICWALCFCSRDALNAKVCRRFAFFYCVSPFRTFLLYVAVSHFFTVCRRFAFARFTAPWVFTQHDLLFMSICSPYFYWSRPIYDLEHSDVFRWFRNVSVHFRI